MKQAVHNEISRGNHQMQYFLNGVLYKTSTWTSKKHAIKDAMDRGFDVHFGSLPKKLQIEVIAENPKVAALVAARFNAEGFDATPSCTGETLDYSKVIAGQKRWIKIHYGETAAKFSNFGWVADSKSFTTKIYGHGILTTTRINGRYVHKFEK
jgi:hypothetical protein